MVRHRLTSHAGFYAPTTALICPCKGNERGLEDNLTALTRFEYANYEIYFSLATSLDPALKIIERVKAASSKPVHIVIAGPPENCSEKVFNLRRAVEALPANFEVLVFTDSDVRLPRGWLTKLIAPLQDGRVGATTAYRWIIPSGNLAQAHFRARLPPHGTQPSRRCSENKGEFLLGRRHSHSPQNFRRRTACSKRGNGALSDDFAMTCCARSDKSADRFLPGMPRRNASSLDRHATHRIYEPPDSNHARLFAAPLETGCGSRI